MPFNFSLSTLLSVVHAVRVFPPTFTGCKMHMKRYINSFEKQYSYDRLQESLNLQITMGFNDTKKMRNDRNHRLNQLIKK